MMLLRALLTDLAIIIQATLTLIQGDILAFI